MKDWITVGVVGLLAAAGCIVMANNGARERETALAHQGRINACVRVFVAEHRIDTIAQYEWGRKRCELQADGVLPENVE